MNKSRDIKQSDRKTSAASPVDAFLQKVEETQAVTVPSACGRLIFGLDATLSRQPTWDQAVSIQSQMFGAASHVGALEMQIAFYRGLGEFRKSKWSQDGADLAQRMSRVTCMGGLTQIARLLRHGLNTARQESLDALVFVGDAMEENPDELCDLAGRFNMYSCPLFIFQEGADPQVREVFENMARLSGGAYAAFEEGSADKLQCLLKAVAIYAAGGKTALKQLADEGDGVARALLGQVRKG